MTVHETGVLDTSIIAALKLYDPAELPETLLITAVTLRELSYGPHATDDPLKRAGRVAVLQAARPARRLTARRPGAPWSPWYSVVRAATLKS